MNEQGKYEFRIRCGCGCGKCHNALILEGVEDASGTHYCSHCDDYVKPSNAVCSERTEAKVKARAEKIAGTAHIT